MLGVINVHNEGDGGWCKEIITIGIWGREQSAMGIINICIGKMYLDVGREGGDN